MKLDYITCYQIWYYRGGIVWSTSAYYNEDNRDKAYRDASEFNRRPEVARDFMHAVVSRITIAK